MRGPEDGSDGIVAQVTMRPRPEAVAVVPGRVGHGVVNVDGCRRPAVAELAHDPAVSRSGDAQERNQQSRPKRYTQAREQTSGTAPAEAAQCEQRRVVPAHRLTRRPRVSRRRWSARAASSGL